MPKFSLFLIFFVSLNALAFWEPFAEGDISTTYIDNKDIKESGNYRYFWIMKDLHKKNNGVHSYVEYYQADCKSPRRLKTLKAVAYSAKYGGGDVVATKDEKSKWSFPVKGSVGQLIMNEGCDININSNKNDEITLEDFFLDGSTDTDDEEFLYVTYRCIAVSELLNKSSEGKYKELKDFWYYAMGKKLVGTYPNKSNSELDDLSFKKIKYYTYFYPLQTKDFFMADHSVCEYFYNQTKGK